jgi:serine/threonine-protein kinase
MAQSMRFDPGTMVRDNLRLVRPLGEGAMGEVWVADHLTLETQVAVKFIHADLATADATSLARFEREATATAQIKSQHVVHTYDRGVMDDGTPYIVMELLEGESLAERLASRGALDVRHACEIVMQVARGLEKAHERGIIHRDIKPENIFLVEGSDGLCAKIVDFGIAKRTTVADEHKRLTHDGNLIGTPAYMSPEHVAGTGTSEKGADLWALSVVAYEVLTGKLPFDGSTIGLVCVAIMKGEHTQPTVLRPELPREVDAFFARAFHRVETRRFTSARELATTLALCFYASREEEDALKLAMEHSGRFSLPPPSRAGAPLVSGVVQAQRNPDPAGAAVAVAVSAEVASPFPRLEESTPQPMAKPASPEPLALERKRAPTRTALGVFAAAALVGTVIVVAVRGGGESGQSPATSASQEPSTRIVSAAPPSASVGPRTPEPAASGKPAPALSASSAPSVPRATSAQPPITKPKGNTQRAERELGI